MELQFFNEKTMQWWHVYSDVVGERTTRKVVFPSHRVQSVKSGEKIQSLEVKTVGASELDAFLTSIQTEGFVLQYA